MNNMDEVKVIQAAGKKRAAVPEKTLGLPYSQTVCFKVEHDVTASQQINMNNTIHEGGLITPGSVKIDAASKEKKIQSCLKKTRSHIKKHVKFRNEILCHTYYHIKEHVKFGNEILRQKNSHIRNEILSQKYLDVQMSVNTPKRKKDCLKCIRRNLQMQRSAYVNGTIKSHNYAKADNVLLQEQQSLDKLTVNGTPKIAHQDFFPLNSGKGKSVSDYIYNSPSNVVHMNSDLKNVKKVTTAKIPTVGQKSVQIKKDIVNSTTEKKPCVGNFIGTSNICVGSSNIPLDSSSICLNSSNTTMETSNIPKDYSRTEDIHCARHIPVELVISKYFSNREKMLCIDRRNPHVSSLGNVRETLVSSNAAKHTLQMKRVSYVKLRRLSDAEIREASKSTLKKKMNMSPTDETMHIPAKRESKPTTKFLQYIASCNLNTKSEGKNKNFNGPNINNKSDTVVEKISEKSRPIKQINTLPRCEVVLERLSPSFINSFIERNKLTESDDRSWRGWHVNVLPLPHCDVYSISDGVTMSRVLILKDF